MRLSLLSVLTLQLIITLFSAVVIAEPFSYLKRELIDELNYKKVNRMNIHYEPNKFKRIWRKRIDFPVGHPLYVNEAGQNDIVLGVVDITGNGDKYYIVYSTGPSYDVNYCFLQQTRVEAAILSKEQYIPCDFSVVALSIIVPGNGNLYSYGHNNTMYDRRSKYTYKNNNIELVPQSFHYIGKKTKSVKDQLVYTDETLKKVAYRITKGYRVTLVGYLDEALNSKGTGSLYIVASEFGLLGWVRSDNYNNDSQFEGFYFNGD